MYQRGKLEHKKSQKENHVFIFYKYRSLPFITGIFWETVDAHIIFICLTIGIAISMATSGQCG